jgi:serine/threonine protein kinase
MASQPSRRVASVRLVEPEVVDEPSDAMTTSYLLDGHVFVRDNVAIMPNGVAMKDSSRTFVVDPESLTYGQVLGRGASSIVQLGHHVPTGTPLALKIINIYDKTKRIQLTREIQALYDADCDCLVSFFGAFYKDGAITIALEYMDQGSLTTLIQSKGPMPEQVLAAMAFQVLWALAYLRVEKRLHRDLKPSNILVNSQGQVRISCFMTRVKKFPRQSLRVSCAGEAE